MRVIALLLIISLFLFFSCGPSPKEIKLVAIGDSITMGIQDGGLVKDYQNNCFPFLIAKQLGIASHFQQPLVSSPGFGIPPYKKPLRLEDGRIIAEYYEGDIDNIDKMALLQEIMPLLENIALERPYDNLGVGGARLHDIMHTTSHGNSVLPGNFFFDIVLRFGRYSEGATVLEQAIELEPEIVLLWIGNNDILGAVLAGGDETLITDSAEFRNDFASLLSELQEKTGASIFMANIPGYLSFSYALDDIFQLVDGFSQNNVPVLFDCETFQPINFGNGEDVYIPLLTEEEDVSFLLPSATVSYLQEGMGIPTKNQLQLPPYDFTESEALALVAAMKTDPRLNTDGGAVGLQVTGEHTITGSEEQVIRDAVVEFNEILQALSSQFNVPLVDINGLWDPDKEEAFGGYSGEFVLDDPVNTVFSLDGVHPNNLGHAVIANVFIDQINERLQLGIQTLNTEDYEGQYARCVGEGMKKHTIRALDGVKDLFR